MYLNLSRIINIPGEVIPFDFDLDMSDVEYNFSKPFREPVHVSGEVRNIAGVLRLSFVASMQLDSVCDRCGKKFDREKVVQYSAVVSETESTDDELDFIVFENDEIDLSEIVSTEIILEMDNKVLCKEDCKGLCAQCGFDLNNGSCGCKKEIDPRFAVLQKLLEKDQ